MAASAPIPADMAVSSKFNKFNLVDATYKEVHGTAIPASILIPKEISAGKHPVLVRWHGGCLITGHRLFPEWFGEWILQLALSKNAILISPDYRLMPEANGLDILQDVRDFYNWLATPGVLASHLPPDVTPDLDHLLVTGESAGGWLSLQSALLPASRQSISAVVTQYPMIDMRHPHYTGDYEKQLFTPTAPQLDRSILREYLSNLDHGKVLTSAVPPDRVPIVISSLQQGAFGKMFGGDSSLYPIEVLQDVDELPSIWLIHGKDDTVIPVEGSYRYEKALKERLPNTRLHVSYRAGDHGFDNQPEVTLDTDWVKEGVAFLEESWPKC